MLHNLCIVLHNPIYFISFLSVSVQIICLSYTVHYNLNTEQVLPLFISHIFIELNCSFLTPTTAPSVYTDTMLYHSYTFWCHAILGEFYTNI